MFESVLLPAPFSPSSACTSPSAASKSTPSLATTPGNRFVMPRSLTAVRVLESCIAAKGGGSAATLPRPSRLALGATDHALHEPVHHVEVVHRQTLALRHAHLALLVAQRAGELVELAADQRPLLRRDQPLRLRLHLRPVPRDVDEVVLEAAVVEAALPAAVHGRP